MDLGRFFNFLAGFGWVWVVLSIFWVGLDVSSIFWLGLGGFGSFRQFFSWFWVGLDQIINNLAGFGWVWVVSSIFWLGLGGLG